MVRSSRGSNLDVVPPPVNPATLRKPPVFATFSATGGWSTPNLFGLSSAEALERQRGADSRIAVTAFGAAARDAAGERARGLAKGSYP